MNWSIGTLWIISVVVFSGIFGYVGSKIGYAKGRKDGDRRLTTKGPKIKI
jgi:hypothetical protein